MSIGTEFGLLLIKKEQTDKVVKARALLQNFRSVVLETNMKIQEIADSGSFVTIDNEIKQVLIAAWGVSKDAQTALEDATIAELLDWRP